MTASVFAVSLVALALLMIGGVIGVLIPRRGPVRLPGWPPKDWRAFLALIASVGGSAALTIFAAWLVWIIWQGGWSAQMERVQLDTLGNALLLTLGGALAGLISFGLAVNRRSISGSVGPVSFHAEGGGDDPPAPAVITTTKTEVQP